MEDDDVPPLAYSSGSEDEDNNHPSSDKQVATWLSYVKRTNARKCQERVVKTLALAPFLFGRREQNRKWLIYCKQVDLLQSSEIFKVDVLTDDQLSNIDLMEEVLDTIVPQLFLKESLGSVVKLIDESKTWKSAKQCISAAKSNHHIKSWYDNTTRKKSEEEKVYMSIVYVCNQYVEHVKYYVKEGKDRAKEFEDLFASDSVRKKIDEIKKVGNDGFKAHNYEKAIVQYTKAIEMDSYNNVLYGNRSQAYLKNMQFREALSDGKRAIVLRQEWAKGHYRFAKAFFGLQRFEDGLSVTMKALEVCDRRSEDYKELEDQRKKFQEKIKAMKKAKEMEKAADNVLFGGKSATVDDSVPDLVSASGSTDEETCGSDDDSWIDETDWTPFISFDHFEIAAEQIAQSMGVDVEPRKLSWHWEGSLRLTRLSDPTRPRHLTDVEIPETRIAAFFDDTWPPGHTWSKIGAVASVSMQCFGPIIQEFRELEYEIGYVMCGDCSESREMGRRVSTDRGAIGFASFNTPKGNVLMTIFTSDGYPNIFTVQLPRDQEKMKKIRDTVLAPPAREILHRTPTVQEKKGQASPASGAGVSEKDQSKTTNVTSQKNSVRETRKKKPKLCAQPAGTVRCENVVSDASDEEDVPELHSDGEPEEEHERSEAKQKIREQSPQKPPVKTTASTQVPQKPPPTKTAASTQTPQTPTKEGSASKQPKKAEKKTDKKSEKEKEHARREKTVEEIKPKKDPRIAQLEERESELQFRMKSGAEALLADPTHSLLAIKYYSEALEMFNKYHHDYFNKDQSQVFLVLYSLGTASVDTGQEVLILEGIDHFKAIIKLCKGRTSFPLTYLGLGRAFCKQNRFEHALPEFRRGLNLVIAGGYCRDVMLWPGTKKPIPETLPGQLKAAFRDHIAGCTNPPKPDAVCRHTDCTGHYKIQIYRSDPDFKGFVRVRCFAKCLVEYHTECWKSIRSLGKEKHSDKDMLNSPCFTPDCLSTISMIIIIDDKGDTLCKNEASRPENRIEAPKTVLKLPTSSLAKIKQKLDRKRLRKEWKEEQKRKRREEEESKKQLEEIEKLSELAPVRKISEPEVMAAASAAEPETNNNVNLDKLTMLKKLDSDSEEDMSYKVSKKSKKKKKDKQGKDRKVFSLGVASYESAEAEVSVDRTQQLPGLLPTPDSGFNQGMDGLDDFYEPSESMSETGDNMTSFGLSEFRGNEANQFENDRGNSNTSAVTTNNEDVSKNIQSTLFSFFKSLLAQLGPLREDDNRILDELTNFPTAARDVVQQAGGVGQFLATSVHFVYIEGIVSLMADMPKVQSLVWTLKQQGGRNNKVRARTLPPDTRSAQQFPSLGGDSSSSTLPTAAWEKNLNLTNQTDSFQNLYLNRPAMRDNLHVREPSTPDSEHTSASDPLDNFVFSGLSLSQTLSQSSIDDRERTDGILSNQDDRSSAAASDAGNNLFMPSAYGDSKSQESSVSDGAGILMSNILPDSSQKAVESFDGDGDNNSKGLMVDVEKEEEIAGTPPMTSPGLIHDIMSAKPLNQMSLSDHPLMSSLGDHPLMSMSLSDHPLFKAPISQGIPKLEVITNSVEEENAGTVRNTSEMTEIQHRSPLPSPLPDAAMNLVPLPLTAQPLITQDVSMATRSRLTPEQATITPPRPRLSLPPPVEPAFNMHQNLQPPHPEEDDHVASSQSSLVSMPTASLASMATASLVSMPAAPLSHKAAAIAPGWLNVDPSEPMASLGVRGHSPARSLDYNAASSRVTPNLDDIDEQFKRETAEDVYNNIPPFLREDPNLKSNILSDIEKNIQASRQLQSRMFLHQKDVQDKGLQTEQSTSDATTADVVASDEAKVAAKVATSDEASTSIEVKNTTTGVETASEEDVVSRSTNTEPREDYEALYKRALLERNHWQEQMRDLADKYNQLQHESQVSISTMRGQLEENNLKVQSEKREALELITMLKHQHQAETQRLQQQLKAVKEQAESTAQDNEQKINELVKRFSEEQRNAVQAQQVIQSYQDLQLRERERSKTSEIQLLELKRDFGKWILERSFRDAEGYVRQCAMQLGMLQQQNKDPPARLLLLLDDWKTTARKNKEIQTQSTEAFNDQINKVRNGEQLSNLPVLHVARPPPPPESAQPGPHGEPRFPNPTLNSRPPGFTASNGQSGGGTSLPTPASLAALAQQAEKPGAMGDGKSAVTLANLQPNSPAKLAAQKAKAKTQASAEANNIRAEHQKNSYIKLLDALIKLYPNHAREELEGYVRRLRAIRGGSLNGMGMDEIVSQISDMIVRDQTVKNTQANRTMSMATRASRNGTPEVYDEEEDPCSICHEEMKPGTTKMLECRHYFHDKCIRKWYREKNECPICRKYAPLDDEFPSLF